MPAMAEHDDPLSERSASPSRDPADEPAVVDDRDVPPTGDPWVPRRIFLVIGAFVLFLTILYWFTSYEDAGTVLLALAAALALWFGIYLWLQQRRAATAKARGDHDDASLAGEVEYLPHASAWPFAIGLGAATFANGLVLGIWVVVPGAALLALGIGGFIHQSRHRY
jgi:hypothetical protein